MFFLLGYRPALRHKLTAKLYRTLGVDKLCGVLFQSLNSTVKTDADVSQNTVSTIYTTCDLGKRSKLCPVDHL